ncbi:sensory box histidine kinase/response regulator [Legionella nautarum]|uniref:Sensory box histidine kinase/response regulator n=1 Tax=Legionella nautarum TaxID=45070 RepID=A0A0W0WWV5_9GAMM|nr:hypothetical protein [Legionella nautarum]KTD36800.1 sensory box histidine kinase/response regulator [Legionella nautarum]
MIVIDEQALTMLIQMVQKSIVLVDADYIIQNFNTKAEEELSLANNKGIGTSLSALCTKEELKQLTTSGLATIELKTKLTPCACTVIIVQEPQRELTSNKSKNTSTPNLNKTTSIINLNDRRYLDIIISQIPVSVYWMNKNYIYQGCSNSMAKLLHLGSRQEIVGKTYEDLYDKKSSDSYKKADSSVIEQ